MEEIENGCLWTGESNTDYLLCEWEIEWLPTLYQQDDIIYEYNQRNQSRSKKSCTIFSAIGAVSDLFNYKFSLDEIKEIDNLSYDKGRLKNSGWRVQSAVDLVAKRWNEKKSHLGKVAYYRIEMPNDEVIKKIIEKGYGICTWYYGNAKYNEDYQKDWVLDGTDFGATTYWHAINLRKGMIIKDNYYGDKYNKYRLAHTPREIKGYHAFGYLYTKVAEDSLDEIKRLNEIKTECNLLIEHLGKLYHLVNDKNFQWILHYTADKLRAKIQDANAQLKKYQ